MNQTSLYDLNANEVFVKYHLGGIANLQNELDQELKTVRENAQQLIRTNYNCMMAVVDNVPDIGHNVYNATEHIQRIGEARLPRNIEQYCCSEKPSGHQRDKQSWETETILMKLLLDTTERACEETDQENFVTAALLLKFAGQVKSSMELTASSKKLLVVLHQQWKTVLELLRILTENIKLTLQSSTLTFEEGNKCLISLALLKDWPQEEVLNEFLTMRFTALEKCLTNAEKIDHGVRFHLVKSLKLICATLHIFKACFLSQDPGDRNSLCNQLQGTARSYGSSILSSLNLDYTYVNLIERIPPAIQECRVLIPAQCLQPVKSEIACYQLSEWLSQVKSCILDHTTPLFDIIPNLKALLSIQDSCQILPDDWKILTKYLNLPPSTTFWQYLYHPLFIAKAKTLLSEYWENSYTILMKEIDAILSNLSADNSIEKGLSTVLWNIDQNFGDEKCNKNNKSEMLPECMYTNVAHTCKLIETTVSSSISSFLEILQRESPESEMVTDLKQHQQQCCYTFVTRMLDCFCSTMSHNPAPSWSVFGAKFLSAIIKLCPSLKTCLSFADEKGATWFEIESRLEHGSGVMWDKWISAVAYVESNLGLHLSEDAGFQINIIPKWQTVQLEQKNEQGEIVFSTVNVPVHGSLPLQQFLHHLNSVCCTVLPPRSCVERLVSKQISDFLEQYELCCEMPLQQVVYIQLMFDVMYIISLLVPLHDKVLLTRCQELVSKFEDKIDPFELDAISSYMMDNVKNFSYRTQALYGMIANSRIRGKSSTSSTSSSANDPNILYTGSQNVPWFSLLPLGSHVLLTTDP